MRLKQAIEYNEVHSFIYYERSLAGQRWFTIDTDHCSPSPLINISICLTEIPHI